jgi:hypothetical protein
MDASAERYLDTLYGSDDVHEDRPMLYESQVRCHSATGTSSGAWHAAGARGTVNMLQTLPRLGPPEQVIQNASSRPSYKEAAGTHQMITTIKGSNHLMGSGTMRKSSGSPHSLSPIKQQANPQQQLDRVIEKIDSKRAMHEQCMLGLKKASELVQSMEAELRCACMGLQTHAQEPQ